MLQLLIFAFSQSCTGKKPQLCKEKCCSIIELRKTGLSKLDISKQLGIVKSTVSKIRTIYHETGSLEVKSRFRNAHNGRMKRMLHINPFITSADLQKDISKLQNVNQGHMRRLTLKDLGYKATL